MRKRTTLPGLHITVDFLFIVTLLLRQLNMRHNSPPSAFAASQLWRDKLVPLSNIREGDDYVSDYRGLNQCRSAKIYRITTAAYKYL